MSKLETISPITPTLCIKCKKQINDGRNLNGLSSM